MHMYVQLPTESRRGYLDPLELELTGILSSSLPD